MYMYNWFLLSPSLLSYFVIKFWLCNTPASFSVFLSKNLRGGQEERLEMELARKEKSNCPVTFTIVLRETERERERQKERVKIIRG